MGYLSLTAAPGGGGALPCCSPESVRLLDEQERSQLSPPWRTGHRATRPPPCAPALELGLPLRCCSVAQPTAPLSGTLARTHPGLGLSGRPGLGPPTRVAWLLLSPREDASFLLPSAHASCPTGPFPSLSKGHQPSPPGVMQHPPHTPPKKCPLPQVLPPAPAAALESVALNQPTSSHTFSPRLPQPPPAPDTCPARLSAADSPLPGSFLCFSSSPPAPAGCPRALTQPCVFTMAIYQEHVCTAYVYIHACSCVYIPFTISYTPKAV